MVRINGKEMDIAGDVLSVYLENAGYDIKRIAVEMNGDILPKSKYNETILKDNDELEVVSFVGGG